MDYSIGVENSGGTGVPHGALQATSGPLELGALPIAAGSTLHATTHNASGSNPGWYTVCGTGANYYVPVAWSSANCLPGPSLCALCMERGLHEYRIGVFTNANGASTVVDDALEFQSTQSKLHALEWNGTSPDVGWRVVCGGTANGFYDVPWTSRAAYAPDTSPLICTLCVTAAH